MRLKYGKRVSLKKVARLTRKHRLDARVRRSFARTTNPKHGRPECENLLNREFSAEMSGQKQVSDITYLRSTSGWVYLATVMDLFDRRIVGRLPGADIEAEHTAVAALKTAFKNRPTREGLLFHSDRGVQYCVR